VKDASEIVHLKVKQIFADPTFNCRGSIAPIDVSELAKDIDKNGLQQPIVVRPLNGDTPGAKEWHTSMCVSGHRRHRAFQVLGRETIPCVVNETITDAEALILNLGENLYRKDLTIIQEANALERLKLEGFSHHQVAEAIGKSSSWVHIRYMLLELPEPIREAAAAGFITQKHVRELYHMKDIQKQMEAAKKIKDAKIRGDKPPMLRRGKKRDILKIKIRDRDDVFWMQDHIREAIGNNFGTRCLAWAAGEINDFELFQDIERIAIEARLPYHIPYELGGIPK
jgi:ParB family chromosome partitioning protein